MPDAALSPASNFTETLDFAAVQTTEIVPWVVWFDTVPVLTVANTSPVGALTTQLSNMVAVTERLLLATSAA